MKRRSKTPSRILAALLAVMMTVTSAPISAFATDLTGSDSQSTSTIIDDPISGETGSGWDNIGGGGDTTITTPPDGESGEPDPDEGDPATPPDGDGGEDGSSSTPEGEDGDDSSIPEDEEGDGSSLPGDGDEDNSSTPDGEPQDSEAAFA